VVGGRGLEGFGHGLSVAFRRRLRNEYRLRGFGHPSSL
jgi:hypothetical protein